MSDADELEKKEQKIKLSEQVTQDADRESLVSEEIERPPVNSDADLKLDPRFEIQSTIGQGGMATVYKVYDKELDKTLALKVLHRELSNDAASVKRFLQEAKAAGQLQHENIVPTYETGTSEDGRPYILFEYIAGENLAQLIKREGPLKTERALKIFEQICSGLSTAHKENIIHRDLKPSNIIISNVSGADHVFLVDFGIAKIQEGDIRKTQDLTQTGDIFGSPEYMSPEQCLNVQVDKRSDLYSLGCVMYKTLTGNAPFTGSNAIQVIAKHLNDVPMKLEDQSQFVITPDIESIVSTCLEKSPELRYKSVDELEKDLEAVQAGKKPIVARRMNLVKRSKPIVPILTILLATISWVVLGLSIWKLTDYTQEQRRSESVIVHADKVSKSIYDAGVAMGGYSITRSPLFEDRYDKIIKTIPSEMYELTKLGGYSEIQERAIINSQKYSITTMNVLNDAKAAIDDNKVDTANFRTRHMYKEIRSLADKIQDELRTITDEEKRKLAKMSEKSPLSEVILAGIFCLLMNFLSSLSILFYKGKKK